MTPYPAVRTAAVHHVADRGPHAHRTIAAALLAAGDGDEIRIAPGVYRECLRVEGRVTLLPAHDSADGDGTANGADAGTGAAPGRVTLAADSERPAVEVLPGGRLTVRNLTVRGAAADRAAVLLSGGTTDWSGGGIARGRLEALGDAGLDLRDARLTGAALAGVLLRTTGAVRLTDCLLDGADGTGLVAGGGTALELVRTEIRAASGSGLRVREDARAVLRDCALVRPGRSGLLVEDRAAALLADCRVRDCGGEAVRVLGSSPLPDAAFDEGAVPAGATGGLVLHGCELSGSGADALAATGSAEVLVLATTLRDCAGSAVAAGSASRVRMVDCRIVRTSGAALMVEGAAQLSATELTVRGSAANGLVATDDSTVRLTDCELRDCRFSAVHLGGRTHAVLTRLRVSVTPEHGVHAVANAGLELTDARIADCGMSGLDLAEEAVAEVSGLAVQRCRAGIIARSAGPVRLSECEVADAERAAVTFGPGDVELTGGRVLRPGTAGLVVEANAGPTAAGVEIRQAAGSGVVVAGGARPLLRDVRILRPGKNGLIVDAGGGGEFEDCEIVGPGFPAVHLGASATPVLRRMRVRDAAEDLNADAGARPVVDDCLSSGVRDARWPETAPVAPAVTGGGEPPAVEASAQTETSPEEAAAASGESLPDLLGELERLVGLARVKQDVSSLVKLMRMVQRRSAAGLAAPPLSRHLVFAGNPGTGKTTVARLYGRILAAVGLLERGHLIEADRSALVGEYVGHTGPKTQRVFQKAMGGVLFIDEAYSLAPAGAAGGNDFGQEAVATLVKLMEDQRDSVVVIVAGYPAEMEHFIDSNPGLSSRFNRTLLFEDYGTEELVRIVEEQAASHQYELTDPARSLLVGYFDHLPRDARFGNGRSARQTFQAMTERQAYRVSEVEAPSDGDLMTLSELDVPELPEPPV
ncbi:right-handed parallel beta-helix repeat-containing protein [Streptomyces sp. H27-D2]|uniref:right-handed parallel beta-helix repeat-containing protein n=1 Tax=Streptomyces sp. H27-D2 TaxID=3046304 RepID=UPI002DB9BB31|nr:right-handed parallel beta-helix repeat-containing protein [Streptomyces sp. H27-D2]MEC4020233.1 right-handed parallel beta-helix repeat-containing protein [Streptomyces sp. H27-D2]